MPSKLGEFATSQWKAIFFMVLGLCLAGVYAAVSMPSSVFPQTDFPRVVIMIDNGEMPADEMMAKITKPIEEAMKDVPGVVNIRSGTSRGSSVVNVFFNWQVNMEQEELSVRSRLAQVRSTLPATVDARADRLTFSVFPIIGISIASKTHSVEDLTVAAETLIKPRFLRIPGVARVDLVGAREPEYHIVADPLKLAAQHISLTDVTDALTKNNLVASGGLHEEKNSLYLTLVDGRLSNVADIENLVVAVADDRPVRVKEFARVERAAEPASTIVTADGEKSVLIMVRSKPDGSTLDIADQLKTELSDIRRVIPPELGDIKMKTFYDQSLLVRDSVHSVWEAIIFGLILSIVIIFMFLKDWGSTLVAIVVIPVTVLITLLAMRLLNMSFNLMTLGGIAAAIGLVIDDAIVVVEAIHTKLATGMERLPAIHAAIGEIFRPLTASTLTPVVVFIPLAFLNGVPGVFFRALAITMTVSLLMSLVLAISLTPSLALLIIRVRAKPGGAAHAVEEGGFIQRAVANVYERAARFAIRHHFVALSVCILLGLAGIDLYFRLDSEMLPKLEEHGFVLDYVVKPPGTSLSETNRALMEIEALLKATPEVESYSRRTGVALGLELTEPNAGDFLVKLKSSSKRSTEEVTGELREKILHREPQIDVEFHGILADLIFDLVSSPEPIEIKVFSTDETYLEKTAGDIQKQIDEIPHVADTNDGIVVSGPSLTFKVRPADVQRYGLSTLDIAEAVETAKLGMTASYVLGNDRITNIRVLLDARTIDRIDTLKNIPLRTGQGEVIHLNQVADVIEVPGEVELNRENLRQFVAVTGSVEGSDLGSVMRTIQEKLADRFATGNIEYGGTFKQQQESFQNLILVMIMAVVLIFTVLLLEFRSFVAPVSIVAGAILSLLGTVVALYLTHTSENIISLLGAIIGIGIVAKNGILMLDHVDHLRQSGIPMQEALVQSGRRRLRPVLMTSMAAALGMLPLAYGIGSGADMLRPLAISVIGALCLSVLLSLVATPALYFLMYRLRLTNASKELIPSETNPASSRS